MYALFLFAALSDPDYATREMASAKLAHLVDGWPRAYGPRVKKWAALTGCPEAHARDSRIAVHYDRWRVMSYVPKSVPVFPCIDMMPVPTMLGDVRCKALGCEWMAETSPGDSLTESPPYWGRYRRATERMARSLIAAGETPDSVDALLLRAWKIEQQYRGDCGDKWKESEGWTHWSGGYPQPVSESSP